MSVDDVYAVVCRKIVAHKPERSIHEQIVRVQITYDVALQMVKAFCDGMRLTSIRFAHVVRQIGFISFKDSTCVVSRSAVDYGEF